LIELSHVALDDGGRRAPTLQFRRERLQTI
jgi:hypothetical protein